MDGNEGLTINDVDPGMASYPRLPWKVKAFLARSALDWGLIGADSWQMYWMPTIIQPSFNSGEWAPHLLRPRGPWQKFGRARRHPEFLLSITVVGPRTRVGNEVPSKGDIKPCSADQDDSLSSSSFVLGFALEFGDEYVRFYQNGAPVLETGLNITGATKGKSLRPHSYQTPTPPGTWIGYTSPGSPG